MDACRTAVTGAHPLSSRVWVPRNCNYRDAETVIGAALQRSSEPSSRLSAGKWPCRVAERRPGKKGLSRKFCKIGSLRLDLAERLVTPIFCQVEDKCSSEDYLRLDGFCCV